MLNAIARWVVTFTALTILLTWCLLNQGRVLVDVSPVHDPFNLPVFAVLLAAALLGFLWGAAILWLAGADARKESRAVRRELRETIRRLHDLDTEAVHHAPERVIQGLLPTSPKKWGR